MPVPFPLVNGSRLSFASIEALIASNLFYGIKEISYSEMLEPGEVYGTSPQLMGRTRGQYKSEASFTLFKEEWLDMQLALSTAGSVLGLGWMEFPFDVVVSYAEILGGPIQTDKIRGCRVKKAEDSHSQGTDALVVKVELSTMYVLRNGLPAFGTLIPG
jgi:hypothetical protein